MIVKSKGLTLKVDIDEDPIHPRKDCDNLGKMLCWHRRYDLGDKNPYKTSQDFWDDKELQNDIFTKLNVFLLDHSGLWVSAAPFTAVDPQGFDSGQVGIIYATKTDVLKEYGDLSHETQAKVNRILLGEIEDYNNYLAGNYYYFTIEDEIEEVIESCGSFTGDSIAEILTRMKETISQEYGYLFDKMIACQDSPEDVIDEDIMTDKQKRLIHNLESEYEEYLCELETKPLSDVIGDSRRTVFYGDLLDYLRETPLNERQLNSLSKKNSMKGMYHSYMDNEFDQLDMKNNYGKVIYQFVKEQKYAEM